MNGQHHKPPGHPTPYYAVPIYDTTALTSALANPYAQQYASSYMSQHYYQAYMQTYSGNGPPRTTPEGYTLSSTYIPSMANPTSQAVLSLPSAPDRVPSQTHPKTIVKPILNHLTYGAWYQPGNCRCTRTGCSFTGSRKSVEIHMMDRHFIFPPGWQKRDEWDADPSLKGKSIAIHGTSLVLDTPEAIDGWIAERKRRFPTAERVEYKKRKLEEAAARGELTPEDIGASVRKKHKRDATTCAGGGTRGFRGQGRRGGRGRLRGVAQRRESCVEVVNDVTNPTTDSRIECREASQKSDSSDDDEAPEVASSKALTTPAYPQKNIGPNDPVQNSRPSLQERVKKISRPKKPPRNPFATRPTLLRNLLLPEIRITVSNLSQAIRFLVDNDFLHDVELRPGEAQERMIEVLESHETPCSAKSSHEKLGSSHEDEGLT